MSRYDFDTDEDYPASHAEAEYEYAMQRQQRPLSGGWIVVNGRARFVATDSGDHFQNMADRAAERSAA
jgi:hypothetical protein